MQNAAAVLRLKSSQGASEDRRQDATGLGLRVFGGWMWVWMWVMVQLGMQSMQSRVQFAVVERGWPKGTVRVLYQCAMCYVLCAM